MAITDDKSEYCIPFLLERLQREQTLHNGNQNPFFLGLNGVQGAGKTTLVNSLNSTLRSEPYNLKMAVLSLDDFYLKHSDQLALAASHPNNPLVQHRGQPSTHDLSLLNSTLQNLFERKETKLPSYDKSLYAGAGDQRHTEAWATVNKTPDSCIDVILLEGWCVGFQALPESDLEAKWQAAKDAEASGNGTGQLGRLALEDVRFVNEALREYESIWVKFNAFVHIDAADLSWVYDWRLEAEVKMRALKGSQNAMTDEQVKKFVDGYYPAYELYTQSLRQGIFNIPHMQLRLIVGKDRRVQHVENI